MHNISALSTFRIFSSPVPLLTLSAPLVLNFFSSFSSTSSLYLAKSVVSLTASSLFPSILTAFHPTAPGSSSSIFASHDVQFMPKHSSPRSETDLRAHSPDKLNIHVTSMLQRFFFCVSRPLSTQSLIFSFGTDKADCGAWSKYELAYSGRMVRLFRILTQALCTTNDPVDTLFEGPRRRRTRRSACSSRRGTCLYNLFGRG